MLPSLYAPNNRTLVAVPDELLRQFVESPQGPKSGAMMDRLRSMPGGSDLYIAVNITALRPLVMIGLARSGEPIPPDAKPFLDAFNLIDSAELTVNLSKAGATSLVVHANDDNAAQKVESILADMAAKYQAKMKEAVAKQKTSDDPVERAAAQYAERFRPLDEAVHAGARRQQADVLSPRSGQFAAATARNNRSCGNLSCVAASGGASRVRLLAGTLP